MLKCTQCYNKMWVKAQRPSRDLEKLAISHKFVPPNVQLYIRCSKCSFSTTMDIISFIKASKSIPIKQAARTCFVDIPTDNPLYKLVDTLKPIQDYDLEIRYIDKGAVLSDPVSEIFCLTASKDPAINIKVPVRDAKTTFRLFEKYQYGCVPITFTYSEGVVSSWLLLFDRTAEDLDLVYLNFSLLLTDLDRVFVYKPVSSKFNRDTYLLLFGIWINKWW